MTQSPPITVVLDPGHGGNAPAGGSRSNNAVGPNGVLEKDLALALVQSSARLLRSARYNVIITREDDRNLPLRERAERAKSTGADVFVSVHFNGHRDSKVDGTEAFVSEGARAKDRALASQLARVVSMSARTRMRAVQTAGFTVLKGEHHIPKTAACLLEVAYLSNILQAARLASRGYVEQLGMAVAQGIMGYASRLAAVQALDDTTATEVDEQVIFEVTREHKPAHAGPISLPAPDRGEDQHPFTIPAGLKFTRWEVEVQTSDGGGSYQVNASPRTGAEGEQTIRVGWHYGPFGKITYLLHVYASPDGMFQAPVIYYDSPGWVDRSRDQMRQSNSFSLGMRGEKARVLYEHLRQRGQTNTQGLLVQSLDGGIISIPVGTAVVILGIGALVVAAVLGFLGFATLGTVVKMAIENGYNVPNAGFKTEAGDGERKQEHALFLNLVKPTASGTPTS